MRHCEAQLNIELGEGTVHYSTVTNDWGTREDGIKALLCCTYFLAKQHIPHTTNYKKVVDLIISCGGEILKGVF